MNFGLAALAALGIVFALRAGISANYAEHIGHLLIAHSDGVRAYRAARQKYLNALPQSSAPSKGQYSSSITNVAALWANPRGRRDLSGVQ